MSILSELNTFITTLSLPVKTGVFSSKPPDEYVVLTPLSDIFEVHANNRPGYDMQEARVSLFSKGNYQLRKKQITTALLNADFTITERRYIGHEDDTEYFNYSIYCSKCYEFI